MFVESAWRNENKDENEQRSTKVRELATSDGSQTPPPVEPVEPLRCVGKASCPVQSCLVLASEEISTTIHVRRYGGMHLQGYGASSRCTCGVVQGIGGLEDKR